MPTELNLLSKFKSLPHIVKHLDTIHPTIIWFSEDESLFATSFEGFEDRVKWLNGAWETFKILEAERKSQMVHLDRLIRYEEGKAPEDALNNGLDFIRTLYPDIGDTLDEIESKRSLSLS